MEKLVEENNKESIGVNLSFNLFLSLSNILFPIVTFPYVSRILGPEGIGKVQFVNSFAQYFILIAALGIPVYGIREVSKLSGDIIGLKKLFTTLLVLNIITSFFFLAVFTIIVYCVPSLYENLKFYFVGGIGLLFSFSNIDWFFSGLQKFKLIALRSFFVKVFFLILLFVTVNDKQDTFPYLIILTGSSILNNIYNIFSARNYFKLSLIDRSDFFIHLKPLIFIFSSIVISSVYSSLDTIILGFIKGFKDVGYYSAASRLVKVGIPILTALSTVLLPKIAQTFRDKDDVKTQKLLSQGLSYVILIGIPIAIGLIALSKEIVLFFSGLEFIEASLTLQIMAPTTLIIGFSTVWVVLILSPNSKDKEGAITVSIGLVISIILNFLLIPIYGHIGAAVSNLISELGVMLCFMYFASSIFTYTFDWKFFVTCLSISLFFFPIVYCIQIFELNNLLTMLLSIFSCIIFYFSGTIILAKNDFLDESIIELRKKIKL